MYTSSYVYTIIHFTIFFFLIFWSLQYRDNDVSIGSSAKKRHSLNTSLSLSKASLVKKNITKMNY